MLVLVNGLGLYVVSRSEIDLYRRIIDLNTKIIFYTSALVKRNCLDIEI